MYDDSTTANPLGTSSTNPYNSYGGGAQEILEHYKERAEKAERKAREVIGRTVYVGVDLAEEPKKSLKMEEELCLCSKNLWN